MNRLTTGLTFLMAALAIGDPARAQHVPTAESEVARLIADLDDDSFLVRQVAYRRLLEIGRPALALLRDARDDESAEMRQRASVIVARIERRHGLIVRLEMNDLPPKALRSAGMQPVPDRHGATGGAIRFAGSGSLIVPDAAVPDVDESFTLAAWIKPSRFKAVRTFDDEGTEQAIYPWGEARGHWHGHFIVSKWNSAGRHGDFIFAVTPSGQLGIGISHSTNGFAWDALKTDRVLEKEQWVHVAATFHRGELVLYVDGKQEARKRSLRIEHTNRTEYAFDDIYVGALWNGGYNFLGVIDEVSIYDRALSQAEIVRLVAHVSDVK